MKIAILTRSFPLLGSGVGSLVNKLQEAGFDVVAVIFEEIRSIRTARTLIKSYSYKQLCEKVLQVCSKKLLARQKPQIATGKSAHFYYTTSHNSKECREILSNIKPDIIILRGTKIIKNDILQTAAIGALNVHYGPLPEFRGLNTLEWGLLFGVHPTITLGFVDEGVDTGPTVVAKRLPIYPTDTLSSLRSRADSLAEDLFIEGLKGLNEGKLKPSVQERNSGRTYYWMHNRLLAIAQANLTEMAKAQQQLPVTQQPNY